MANEVVRAASSQGLLCPCPTELFLVVPKVAKLLTKSPEFWWLLALVKALLFACCVCFAFKRVQGLRQFAYICFSMNSAKLDSEA